MLSHYVQNTLIGSHSVIFFFHYAVIIITLFGCNERTKTSQNKSTDTLTSPVAIDTSKTSVDTLVSSSRQKTMVPESGTWKYEKTTNRDGQTIQKASTNSPNLLEFAYPYNGGSVVTLTLRKRGNDTHVYVQISKGQFNRSFQGGNARIRFDEKPPVTYPILAAENGSANIIFLGNELSLIKQLKASKRIRISLTFAGQDNRQIEFKTAGLRWE